MVLLGRDVGLMRLADEGEGFWTDNFDYFTGYDPSSGFVQ